MINKTCFKACMVALLAALIAPPAAAGQPVQISAKDCKRLVKHNPAPDVAYKAGVDVRGKKVAGADLGGSSPLKMPNVITFDMTKDLSGKGGSSETSVGKVKFDIMSGKLTYNGQPVGSGAEAELARKCRQLMQGR